MYDELIRLLKATDIPCAEDAFNNAPQNGSYIVYTLDGEGESLWGSNMQLEQVIVGYVDLFSRTNDRVDFGAVQQAFKIWGGSWDLYSIQYEPNNRIRHYRWKFEMEKL
ncbi:MAG: hypothetical protein J6T26_03465 [Firmicutes bacterium]|nr:hypothetical protein [Bacillota bacterium]